MKMFSPFLNIIVDRLVAITYTMYQTFTNTKTSNIFHIDMPPYKYDNISSSRWFVGPPRLHFALKSVTFTCCSLLINRPNKRKKNNSAQKKSETFKSSEKSLIAYTE